MNLVTRLRGEAYSFYNSCSPQQRGSYEALVEAFKKRFTPVRIQAVQSGLFHERKQKERETVDGYAQALKVLFGRAYPSAQRGSAEAETMGRYVLTSQFVSGLLPQIKSNIAGVEEDFDTLLTKAWFEEAKLRELGGDDFRQRKPTMIPRLPRHTEESGQTKAKPTESPRYSSPRGPKCYGCGNYWHLKIKCPARNKGGPPETPAKPPAKPAETNANLTAPYPRLQIDRKRMRWTELSRR